MRLKTTIQKNMILIIAATLVIAYAMTTFVVYRQTVRVMEDEVRQEADYICTAIEISGLPTWKKWMQSVKTPGLRWITEDGEVLYDSGQDEETEMENHADRPEVKEALENGRGSNVRRSDTLNEEMFYYAVRSRTERSFGYQRLWIRLSGRRLTFCPNGCDCRSDASAGGGPVPEPGGKDDTTHQ